MCELEEEKVLHRDLAARNILCQSMDPVHIKVRKQADSAVLLVDSFRCS